MLAPFPDPVDQRALDAFTERSRPAAIRAGPVCDRRYNAEDGIGGVLDQPGRHCLDLPVDVCWSWSDGAADETAAVAMAHGAYTCVAPVTGARAPRCGWATNSPPTVAHGT